MRIIEFAGLGPVPFAGMLLADMGADVVVVERPNTGSELSQADRVLRRGRRSIAGDLRTPAGLELVKLLVAEADGLIEGFRPGVMERLGVGPDVCCALNERLVYGRMTGWGQTGPNARRAGHDINFVALSGALNASRRRGELPVIPPGLIGDFGGGGAIFAFGVLCGIVEARRTGRGQVMDAAMTEGVAALTAALWGLRATGEWSDEPGTNFSDSGSHFYDTYECADGRLLAMGAVEPKFYAELCRLTGFEQELSGPPDQYDRSTWPARKRAFAELLRSRTRDEWCDLLEGSDACVSPVLTFDEAPTHPHHHDRGTYVTFDGIVQPAPTPRFSVTPGAIQGAAPEPGHDTDGVIADWLGANRRDVLRRCQ